MNELVEFAVWAGGLFTAVPGLMYVLAVIDPRTDSSDARSSGSLAGPAHQQVAQPALAGPARSS